MKTDNELIAEFMGFTCDNEHGWYEGPRKEGIITAGFGAVFAFNVKDSLFGTSWDWLMPPCQKLMTLFKSMDNNEVKFDDRVQFNFIRGHIERAIWNYLYSSGSIIDVHSELVKAIKWYNSQAEYKR